MKTIRVRVNKEGLMNSATRKHRVKKGKGSYSRKELRKKMIDTLSQFWYKHKHTLWVYTNKLERK